ncbi:MAG TPA: inorganic phosphate transporter, partial [bacterium]|nr:inorganic phosphate transporter [bacterium]
VALAAGLTLSWMTRAKLPVATSQAIVGAILGWNWFTKSPTDVAVLSKIVATWFLSPLLASLFAVLIYLLFKRILGRARIHILRLDAYTRAGLIIVGALGSYTLGANNIANVMGVFVPASPFHDIPLFVGASLHGTQQLFLLGALAIATGIYTYSQRMMQAVGNEIFKLTPILALIVVLAHTIVLFIFASTGLKRALLALGLPTIPLVPVSSSQAIVGAIFGIGMVKGMKGLNFRLLGRIAAGWIITPVFAALISFSALFFVQNVFEQEVIHRTAVPQAVAPPVAVPTRPDTLSIPDTLTTIPVIH